MVAALVLLFRIGAAVLLLPLAARAAIAGEWVAALFTLAVLALMCSAADPEGY